MVKLLLQNDLKLEKGCNYLLSEFCLFFFLLAISLWPCKRSQKMKWKKKKTTNKKLCNLCPSHQSFLVCSQAIFYLREQTLITAEQCFKFQSPSLVQIQKNKFNSHAGGVSLDTTQPDSACLSSIPIDFNKTPVPAQLVNPQLFPCWIQSTIQLWIQQMSQLFGPPGISQLERSGEAEFSKVASKVEWALQGHGGRANTWDA